MRASVNKRHLVMSYLEWIKLIALSFLISVAMNAVALRNLVAGKMNSGAGIPKRRNDMILTLAG